MNEQVRNLADAASHAQLLDRLAEVAVRVGLGLKPGQELVVTAPLDARRPGPAHHGACLHRPALPS